VEVNIPERRIDLVEGNDDSGNVLDGDTLLRLRKDLHQYVKPSGRGAFEIYRSLARQALSGGTMFAGQ
ncbi:MAG: hypothetical protein ACM3XR_02310, partial [Bacillota bacterium]